MPMHGPLSNPDLAPVPPEKRTWNLWHVAALWVGMAVCIPTYMLASGLIQAGMSWWQAVFTVLLGNLIVLIPLMLNAQPGTKYGIPFPVLLRASFGTRGSNVPALMRGFVACGWFGIQAWIGGKALHALLVLFGLPGTGTPIAWIGVPLAELVCFLAFWLLNLLILMRGMDGVKWLEVFSAPFLILIGFGMVIWAVMAADGFGPILDEPSQFTTSAQFWAAFAPGLTGMVAYWATLSLNIPDFSRYARSQRDQALGQAIGLPATMALYSWVGVVVTSATLVVYGEAIWDPVTLLSRIEQPLPVAFALVALMVATLSTNIAANVVSPANDFANVWPSKIGFRTGVWLTGVVGLLLQPWRLVEDPSQYVFTWLIGYSALLGPVAGIMIADYFLCRNRTLNLAALYEVKGEYRFTGGFSLVGLGVLFVSILPNLPGFLVTIRFWSTDQVPGWLVEGYHYAWFVGFFVALILYTIARKIEIALTWNRKAYQEYGME